ncbi:hypothetical protein Csa_007035 [Cucumis sativus]|uniref:Uncharacterized protein n=1 Tax=Cucumis sativus TaxID=3659 RepID=A0A0A0LY66_CUCSA|nr:hypothetical protein Csa_007035 [Cucumis sativus]
MLVLTFGCLRVIYLLNKGSVKNRGQEMGVISSAHKAMMNRQSSIVSSPIRVVYYGYVSWFCGCVCFPKKKVSPLVYECQRAFTQSPRRKTSTPESKSCPASPSLIIN